MTKLVQFFSGANEPESGAEPDPAQAFLRETAAYMGTGRLMRQQMERLAALPYKPREPAWVLINGTDATSRVAAAMARLLSAQAASARSLALLRDGGPKHVVIEHRRTTLAK